MLLEYLRITGGQNLLALGANNSGRGVGGAPVYWAALGLLGERPSWADNRVELAAEIDRFGLLGAKVTFNLHDNDKRLITFGQRKVEEIMRAAGAQEVAQEARFAHLIGGARMGLDPRDSVMDGFGCAHDIPNLFICDGSILPTQGSAHPGLTIQALPARVADYLIAEQERVLDGGPRRGTPSPAVSGTNPVKNRMNPPTRILLIDERAIFRCGVRRILEIQPGMRVVGEARTGEEGLARLTELGGVDVIITEIALPGIDGIEVAQRAKALETPIKVILLTFRADEEHLRRMIEVGADGYMLKQAASAELIDAIHSVARGEVAQAPAVAGRLIDHSQIGRERERRAAPRRTWGRQFLAFIARRLTSKEIARQIDNSTASADDESGIAR